MSNYNSLKATINANIKTNGNQEITGSVLNAVLTAMVNTLGAGYVYAGVATPSTDPGTPDAKVFYLAASTGTYTNFGSLVLADGEIALLKWDTTWSKDTTGIASRVKLDQVSQEVFGSENVSLPYSVLYTGSKYYEAGTIGQNISTYYHSSGGNSGIYYGTIDVTGKTGVVSMTYLAGVGSTKNSIMWAVTDESGIILAVENKMSSGSSYSRDIDLRGLSNPSKIYFAYYKSNTPTATLNYDGVNQRITALNDRVNQLDIFPSYSQLPTYDGWVDSSNKIVSYGSSKFKAIPVTGGETISISRNAERENVAFFVVKSFNPNYTLPYTPDLATGETGRRSVSTTFPVLVQLPSDAAYILVNVANRNDVDVSPDSLLLSGYDIMDGARKQLGDLQKIAELDYDRNVKAERIVYSTKWGQGCALIGDKIVGFNAAEDDHSTTASYRLFNAETLELVLNGSHNLGHVNSADYSPITDTLVTTSSETQGEGTHSPKIILIPSAQAKTLAGDVLSFSGSDTIVIPINNLSGNYTGLSCFGERENILYLITLEDSAHFGTKPKRYLYKILLGMGSNDLSASYGTFISGKADNEYNGTASLVKSWEFDFPSEIQGGKYINGIIAVSVDFNYAGVLQAYQLRIRVADSGLILDDLLKLPSESNGARIKTEAEDFVVLGGNRFIHQSVRNSNGMLFEYYA